MLAGFCNAKITQIPNHRGKIRDYAHSIKINSESVLFDIIGKNECLVNTNHSEAVSNKNIGNCIITAISSDGIIEAIEIRNPWHKFVIGIQSHPEYFVKYNDEFAVKLFSAFIEECR